jgi:hypothetical protein
MERSKALEAAQALLDLESAERFLDEVVSERETIADLPDKMYDALYSFAKEWVEKYKQKLADL